MVSITCPACGKGLRAKALTPGQAVKCPGCGHSFAAPEPVPAPAAPAFEVVEDEPAPTPAETPPAEPSPAKKRKPVGRKPQLIDRGRTPVLVVIGVAGLMMAIGWVQFLTIPDTAEATRQQTQELNDKLTQGLSEDVKKKVREQTDETLKKLEDDGSLRQAKTRSLYILIGSSGIYAALLLCLYRRQNWARVVLGVLSLIGALLGGIGLLMFMLGGALKYFGTGAAILAVFESLVRLGVSAGIGVTLMQNEDVIAYTSPRG